MKLKKNTTLAISLFLLAGCNSDKTTVQSTPLKDSQPTVAELSVPEPWISEDKSNWPQLVLTNQADFVGHTSLNGASGFLLETDEGTVLAATARHLIGANGGVEPEIAVDRLPKKIKSWRMYPRTLPNDFVEVESLACEGLDNDALDWLLLSIKNTDKLPSRPLCMRRKPVSVGEKIFLLGCPYSEGECKQNVYSGMVTERAYSDRFRYDLDPPVDIRGFSGAPIMDVNGLVVGVMTVWFDPKMSGDDFLEAGGEDVASICDLLEAAIQVE